MPDRTAPIGIFDSGIGGLAVLDEVHRLLPSESLIYYADTAYFPYGPRPRDQVRARADAITRALIANGCKLIVVACNTATSAAVAHLRDTFPDVPFVSIEPALKPAAEQTIAGRVALLVTPGTAEGDKLAALIGRYGQEVTVSIIPARGLAEAVESGGAAAALALVDTYAAGVRATGADVLALGCTHYAFVQRAFESALGDGIAIIEPSEAIARQVKAVLAARRLLNEAGDGTVRYLTSGDEAAFERARARLRAQGVPLPESAPAR